MAWLILTRRNNLENYVIIVLKLEHISTPCNMLKFVQLRYSSYFISKQSGTHFDQDNRFRAANVSFALYGIEIGSTGDVGRLINLSFPIILSTFVDYQFCILALTLKERFTWLNEDIEHGIGLLKCNKLKTLRPLSFAVSNGFLQDRVRYRLGQIRFQHFQLYTMCKDFNNIYSLQILVTITQSFLTVVVIVIYAGRRFIVFKDITDDYIVYSYLQISLSAFQICSLAITCSYTANEAAKTGVLIHILLYAQRKAKWKKELYFEILDVLRRIDNFDKQVRSVLKVSVIKEYRKAQWYIFLTLAVTICYSFATVFATAFGTAAGRKSSFAEFLLLTMPAIMNTLVDYQFCVLALSIKQRFSWLNDSIDNAIQLLKCDDFKWMRPLSLALVI
ncbi:hypothetical protein FQR65_LT08864 [Abscondita terminalis]|nr:hypothetical protein FQR65_LT08864 [Abscondita terminalis]